MKRKLSLLIALVMLFQLVPLQIFADEVLTLDVSCVGEISELNADDEFTLNFAFKNNSGIASFAVVVGFPKDVISIVPFTDDDDVTHYISYDTTKLTNTSFLSDNGKAQGTDGKIKVGFARQANAKSDFTFASITFKVNNNAKPDDYNITLVVDKADVMDKDKKELAYTYDTSIPFHIKGQEFTETMSLTGAGTYTYGDTMNVGVTGAPDDATITYTVNNNEVEADKLAETIKNVDTYTVSAKVEKTGFETKTFDAITVTVTPKDVTISGITAEDKVYDGTTDVTVDTSKVTFEGKIDGDDLVATFPEFKLSSADVGSYTLDFSDTALSGNSAKNYTLKEIKEVTVNVTQKPIHIVINDATKVAGIDSYALTWKLAEGEAEENIGLISGDLEVNIPEDKAGEKYTITLGTLNVKDTKNYKLVVDEVGTLTIVEKAPKTVTVTDNMTKTEYYEGETLIPDGITVVATFEGGITENVNLVDCDFTPSVMPEVNADTTETVTLKYLGVKATNEDGSDWSETVTVKDNPITGITVDADGAQKVYKVGDTLSNANLVVTATYKNSDLKPDVEVTDYTLSADLTTKVEYTDVTVSYDGKTATYQITVMDKYLTDLKVVATDPTSLSLIEGQTFTLSKSSVDVKAVYSDGSEESVKDTFSGDKAVIITKDSAGSVTNELSYTTEEYGFYAGETKSCEITVNFTDKSVTGIQVLNKESDSINTKYYEGDTFNPTGVEIKLYYNNGTESDPITENYSNYGISFYPATLTKDTTKVTVSVGEFSDTIDVTVEPVVVTGIKITKINKGTYVDGESFSKDDIVVTAYYNNETNEETKDYTVSHETFTLANKTVEETIEFTVYYTKDQDRSSYTSFTIVPCVAIVDGVRYGDLDEAIDAADEGDTIELPLAGEYDVDVDKELTFENTSGEDITITINDEEVTIADGETYEVEIEEEEEEPETDSTYFAFYLQMLQWRNRTFLVSYKQTEGGTISGANSARFSQSVTFTVTPNEGYEIADVTVNGKSVGAVETYTIKNIKANTTVSASFNKIETETVEVEIVPETTVWLNPFTDVSENDAFYAAVEYVYENGLFKGMSETEFAPATTMTRAMFVTVLGRLTGVNVDDYTTVTFSDCEAGSWYAPYVEWAAKAGIVKGMSATEFAPDAEITVEQAVTILYRYMTTMGYDLSGAANLANYADGADVADWAAEAMQWAVANNIYVADTLAPQTAAARSLVATMLYNLSNLLVK